MTKDYSNIYERVTNEIIAQLEKGEIPWRKPWSTVSGAYNIRNNKPYAMLNQWALGTGGAWGSYKAWSEKGYQVKKGEKASYVLEWFFKKFDREKTDENGDTVNSEFIKWYPRCYPVFHESQIENYTPKKAKVTRKPDPIKSAEKVIIAFEKFSGIKKIKRDKEVNEAFYSPVKDFIQVPMLEQYKIPNEYYSTLFHEMTHSTGHSSRLNRGLDEKLASFGSKDYSKEELVAEFGSAMCCARLGIDTDFTMKNSSAYIKGWLKQLKNDASLLVSASSYAEKAVKYIFNDK